MKQSAAKTLGVAALGAAFAAAGAGAANAAPAGVPDPAAALGPVSSVVPVGGLTGATESLSAGQSALDSGVKAAAPTVAQAAPQLLGDKTSRAAAAKPKPKKPASPVSGLLGGLPLGGSGVNGLPLG